MFSGPALGGARSMAEVLKLSVLSDIETSGPTLIQVLLVQMSERSRKSGMPFGSFLRFCLTHSKV